MKNRTVYRDSKTGRFVSKSTWNRSKSHGGSRYKRQRVAQGSSRVVAKRLPPPTPSLPPGDYPVKVQATRKGKRGTHEKLLDIRVITRRPATRPEIAEALRQAATGGKQDLLKVQAIAWSQKSGEMKSGGEADLKNFAALILAPEDIRVEE